MNIYLHNIFILFALVVGLILKKVFWDWKIGLEHYFV